MKNGILKRAVSTALAGFLAITSSQFAFQETYTNAAKVLETSPGHTQETGTYNGYHHEIWQADTPNSSTMTLADEGGGFSTKWQCGPNNSRGNFLARRGLFWGRNNPNHWQDYGNFTCDFDCDWSAGSSGNSRICIYGWTENPLVEYYIIEDWKNWVPSSANAKQVTIDGSVYDVFTNAMNSYNITNTNGPFTQYISVRRTPRTSGTISIYKHFEAWESLGMKMGNLYEVAFNVEGWESDGQANVKKNIITYDGKPTDDDPVETTEPPKADENGDYITEDFESGKGSFKGRGDASLSVDTKNYYDGKSSLKVSDRGDNWHGGAISLSASEFVPGQTYSISAAGLQNSGSATDLKLTLEYTAGGTQDWMEIASSSAKSGEWTKLENTKFTVPTGATGMTVYIEAPKSLTDIWLDSFKISESGKASSVKTGGGTVDGKSNTPSDDPVTTTPSNPSGSGIRGDFNSDKRVDTFDLVTARKALVATMSGSANAVSLDIADLDGNASFAVNDIVLLSKFLLGQIKEFPKAAVVTTTSQAPAPIVTTTASKPSQGSGNYMKSISNDMQINAPSNFTQNRGGVDYGKMEKVTYYSKDGQMNKNMNVLLPPGYNKNEKYPVLYVLHGIFGDETSMPGMGIQTMVGNLIADGEAEKMIVVFPAMFTGSGSPGFTSDSARKYDLIREDIENSIMPYMEEHYSIKTGKENTAITGFSMGGREALYTGITRSEIYGYVGAACPAPGIFETTDAYMHHDGNMQPGQFKPSSSQSMILISAAANDGVVRDYPSTYHDALTQNGVEHLWQIIPQGDHGGATVTPHMYNFLRYIFKA